MYFSAQALKTKKLHLEKIYYALGNGKPQKILIYRKTETLKKSSYILGDNL